MDYFHSKRFLDTLPDWERGRPAPGPMDHYLPRVRVMLRRCGDPQQRCPSVVVAGTNGKGTTASLLAALLQAGGRRVGLYTSPHLHSQRERIQVDGAVLDKDAWAAGLTFLQDATHGFEAEGLGAFSRFEALTVLAAHLFAEAGIDLAVYEVGLGGRYDATNAWDHETAVLTRIDRDHCGVLGHDLAGIADDKLQVTRPGRPLFTIAAQPLEVLEHVQQVAAARGLPLFVCEPEAVAGPGEGDHRAYLTRPDAGPGRPCTWVENARLALAAAAHLMPDLTGHTAHAVLDRHRWSGRFEMARQGPEPLLLDGAHNPGAAAALRADLQRLGPGRWRFVVGVNEDHEAQAVLRCLAPIAADFVLTSSEHPKAVDPQALAAWVPTGTRARVEVSWQRALQAVTADPARPVCVTGSLHLVARAREYLGLPHELEGISEDVSRESLTCVAQASTGLGLQVDAVSRDGNVMRVRGGRRPLLFYRNKHPFNDYVAARLAEDKGYQYELFADLGLPVPFTLQLFNPYADDRFNRYKTHRTVAEMVADVEARMSYPVLVKKSRSSVSQGVYLETDAEGVGRRLQALFENAGFLDNLVLVQAYVEGPEFRAVASQGELLLAYAKESDGDAGSDLNPLHHPTGRAERLTDAAQLAELEALVGQVSQAIDLGLYAIDLIRDPQRGWQILELNPNPFCYFYNRSNGRGDFVDIYRRLLEKYAL